MKKVLIICYYWPPAGGPGVQRWLKFVKYLQDFDIEPIVYAPQNPNYPIIDEKLVAEIPQGITVLKQPIAEPYALAKIFSKDKSTTISSGIINEEKKQSILERIMLYVRGNFFIPDARKFWVKPSVNYLSKYLLENPVDAIITTGPPHSLHLIGLSLKAKLKTVWIADFRDPWTTIHYHDKLKMNEKARQKHTQLELKVLNGADQIITTSQGTKTDFENLTDTPVTCITNGFDDFELKEVKPDTAFTLSHIGSLLADRNPKILWETLQELCEEEKGFKEDFKLKLAGKVSSSVLSTIKKYGLESNLELAGYLTHEEALIAQRSAQILLLIESNSIDTKSIIPGKVFEYLAARRPIIGIGPENADFFKIVEETHSGKCFDYGEKLALKKAILAYYRRFLNGSLPENKTEIQKFSRKFLTNELATLIKSCLVKTSV
ncbi:MAG: glycosyl transferase family 1 [Leeuwenhoekiella sp.]